MIKAYGSKTAPMRNYTSALRTQRNKDAYYSRDTILKRFDSMSFSSDYQKKLSDSASNLKSCINGVSGGYRSKTAYRHPYYSDVLKSQGQSRVQSDISDSADTDYLSDLVYRVKCSMGFNF